MIRQLPAVFATGVVGEYGQLAQAILGDEAIMMASVVHEHICPFLNSLMIGTWRRWTAFLFRQHKHLDSKLSAVREKWSGKYILAKRRHMRAH